MNPVRDPSGALGVGKKTKHSAVNALIWISVRNFVNSVTKTFGVHTSLKGGLALLFGMILMGVPLGVLSKPRRSEVLSIERRESILS